jgi:hypothetical protein
MGLDRYAYANNSPVVYSDPSGHNGQITCLYCNIFLFSYSSASSFAQGAIDLFGSLACDVSRFCYIDTLNHTVWTPIKPNTDIVIVPDIVIPSISPTSGNSSWSISLGEFDTGRASYESEVRAIKDQAGKMIQDGYSLKEASEWASNQRMQLGIKYKNLTPPELLADIYKRNIEKYGNQFGPSVEDLLRQGKTYEEIIDSAATPGGQDIVPQLRWRIMVGAKWK